MSGFFRKRVCRFPNFITMRYPGLFLIFKGKFYEHLNQSLYLCSFQARLMLISPSGLYNYFELCSGWALFWSGIPELRVGQVIVFTPKRSGNKTKLKNPVYFCTAPRFACSTVFAYRARTPVSVFFTGFHEAFRAARVSLSI